MQVKRLYTNILLAVGMTAAVGLAIGSHVTAQVGQESVSNTANTLKVSPVRTDETVDPGEETTVRIIVSNPSEAEIAVRPIQNDFVAGSEEDGTPALILDENEFAPSHSLKRFLQPLENVTIPAGESRNVDAVISVPADAEPGGYFGAIRFAPVEPDTGGQVNTSASVASLILLTVSGDAPQNMSMTDFQVQRNGKPGMFFVHTDNIDTMVRFHNQGNVQLGPFGKISITKGDEIVHEVDFNNKDQRDMVLPDSARRWSVPVSGVEGFGKYTVSATFTYGTNNQTIEAISSFWVIPLPILIGAGVLLIAIIGAVVGLVLHRKNGGQGVSLGK